jgi:hypothetical protein
MKSLARACLRLVILSVPVVIAACYGMAAKFNKRGKVIDKDTLQGISDISVKCMSADGHELDVTRTYNGDGDFVLSYDVICDHLDAVDSLTPARYQEISVPFSEPSPTVTIPMGKVE